LNTVVISILVRTITDKRRILILLIIIIQLVPNISSSNAAQLNTELVTCLQIH